MLPWRPESNAVARMFCNIRTPDGKPFEGDPRHVLARVVGKAQDMGYVFNVGPEVEFYYFKDAEGTELLDRGGYFDLTSLDYASDLRRDTVLTLETVSYTHLLQDGQVQVGQILRIPRHHLAASCEHARVTAQLR